MAGRGSVRGSGGGGGIRVRWGDGSAERGGDSGRVDTALGEKKSTKEEPVPVHGASGHEGMGDVEETMRRDVSPGGRDRPMRIHG